MLHSVPENFNEKKMTLKNLRHAKILLENVPVSQTSREQSTDTLSSALVWVMVVLVTTCKGETEKHSYSPV